MKFATVVKCATMFCTYIVIVVVASLATDSAFAQEPPTNANDPRNANDPSSPRHGAVHECSTEVEKWSDRDWETTKSARYGACMLNHGQVQ